MALNMLAVIREDECIGCTKCIDACPVDAILGSAKYMHTVITQECIGCKLCVPPCPVDCIDLVPMPETLSRIPPDHVKQRVKARQKRLAEEKIDLSQNASMTQKKQYVLQAILRAKMKK